MDVVTLDVLWNRLINTATEQMKALVRTAFSTIVRESEDCAAGVFDRHGVLMAQAPSGTPGQINSIAVAIPNFLAVFPAHTLKPGDVMITNDPWRNAGHLNDITVITPIFRGEELVAFFGSCAHALDIGGRGFSSEARSLYEEGIFIPICKLAEGGKLNETLLQLIRHNVRSSEFVVGDILAQMTCNEVGGQRLLELMTEFKLDNLDELSREITSRSEHVMREAIRGIPDGAYEGEVMADGFDERICIHCTVHVKGDDVTVDFTGSSPQVNFGINVPLCYTASYTTYSLKCMLAPHVPNNAGTFRPIKVTAPSGTILNAEFPAPVAGRHIIGNFQPLAVYDALSKADPSRVIGCSSVLWITTVRGKDEREKNFTLTFFSSGGMGARCEKDGLNTTSFPGNIAMTPVEMIEVVSPVVVREKSLLPDTAGPGRSRGGFGQVFRFGVRTGSQYEVNTMCDQTYFPLYGLAGGGEAARGTYGLSNGEEPPLRKAIITVPADTDVIMRLPGGGGFGNPLQRDPAAVRADVEAGLLSVQAARDQYGVVVRLEGGEATVDAVATSAERAHRVR